MFFSYFPISSRRQELWLVHFFLSFPGLAEVLSQGIYLLNKWLRNWIVGDTVAPQGAIKPGPFFFFNTIQKYCQHIVIDSENLFPEFYLLKLRNLIRAIDIHGDKSQSFEALTKSHRLYPTCGLLSRGSAFLTVSGFACSVLFLFSVQILSLVFTPIFSFIWSRKSLFLAFHERWRFSSGARTPSCSSQYQVHVEVNVLLNAQQHSTQPGPALPTLFSSVPFSSAA